MLCSLKVPAPGAGDGAAQEAQRVTSCSFTGEINIDAFCWKTPPIMEVR